MARVALCVLAVGAVRGAWVQLSSPQQGPAAHYVRPTWLLGAYVAAAACGVTAAAASRRGVAAGMAVMLAAVLLPAAAAWPLIPAAARTTLLAASPWAVAGLAILAAIPRSGAILALALCASATQILAYDPFSDPACWETCIHINPMLRPWLPTDGAIAISCLCVLIAAAVATVGLVRRRPVMPRIILASTAVVLALLMTSAALRLLRWDASIAAPAERLLPALAVTWLGVAALIADTRRRRTLRAMRQLVDRLANPEAALSANVAGIGSVDFAVPDSSDWVDAFGHKVAAPNHACLTLTDPAGPVLRLHLSADADERTVLAALSPSIRLALRNAQLTAAGKAQLADVQASRRRIVRASDAERRRIERDLHDGAQQRLVSAALHLQVARTRVPPPAAAVLGQAEERLRQALARLRRLVHGVFPTALADDGLLTAVEELAAGATVALSLDVQIDTDLDPEVAMAAYATIADTVAAAPPTADVVNVRARLDGRDLTVNLILPDAAPDLAELLSDAADRVGALGGTLTVAGHGRDAHVTAVIPCASSSPTM